MAQEDQAAARALPYAGVGPEKPASLIAPAPQFAEKANVTYERKLAPAIPGNRGPLRFEEGLGTDTDVPNDFVHGMMDGYSFAPGRPNHKAKVDEKYPEETMSERAHVGSASWIEAPTFLGEFAHGSFNDYAEVTYEEVDRGVGTLGRRWERINPCTVDD